MSRQPNAAKSVYLRRIGQTYYGICQRPYQKVPLCSSTQYPVAHSRYRTITARTIPGPVQAEEGTGRLPISWESKLQCACVRLNVIEYGPDLRGRSRCAAWQGPKSLGSCAKSAARRSISPTVTCRQYRPTRKALMLGGDLAAWPSLLSPCSCSALAVRAHNCWALTSEVPQVHCRRVVNGGGSAA